MSEKIYLSTGELAKMLGVTKQTVIYYDKVGLISPAKREKEYRYYTLEQADELDSILTFRDLGVPISVLKDYLRERTAESCIEMLKKQKEKLEIEIQKLDRIRKKIDGRARLLENVIKVKNFQEVKFSKEKTQFYMIEKCKENDEKSFMESFIKLCNHSKQLQIDFENPVCNIIKKEALLKARFRDTAYFGINIAEDFYHPSVERFEKPEGIYASTYHQGTYETMYISYERLINRIQEEGYIVCGNAYETDLLSTLTNIDKNEYMKHISIQVSKVSNCIK